MFTFRFRYRNLLRTIKALEAGLPELPMYNINSSNVLTFPLILSRQWMLRIRENSGSFTLLHQRILRVLGRNLVHGQRRCLEIVRLTPGFRALRPVYR